MPIDISKILFHSNLHGFVNTAETTGSFNISGSAGPGLNIRTVTATLPTSPDMAQILFSGPSDEGFTADYGDQDPRPSDAWFSEGYVWVRGDNGGAGYTNYPTPWTLSATIVGNQLTITARYTQTFSDGLGLSAVTVYFKLVDYKVFSS